ncbi:Hly-III-related protein [Penicillium sp. IBT 35674x]|nr:Hly-III-related protein [Penicillium sp. IBT 35674x]
MSLISLFGLSYFSVLFAQTLLFHSPSIDNEILKPVSVIVFCTGVMIWCFLTLLKFRPPFEEAIKGHVGHPNLSFEL